MQKRTQTPANSSMISRNGKTNFDAVSFNLASADRREHPVVSDAHDMTNNI